MQQGAPAAKGDHHANTMHGGAVLMALVAAACMLPGHRASVNLLLTFTKGARQLVVQEALEMIWSLCL